MVWQDIMVRKVSPVIGLSSVGNTICECQEIYGITEI